MHRRVVLSLTILLALAAVAHADPLITLSTYTLAANDPGTAPANNISISLTGAASMSSLSLYIMTADGGEDNDVANGGSPFFGGTATSADNDGPLIVGANMISTGTWGPSGSHDQYSTYDPSNPGSAGNSVAIADPQFWQVQALVTSNTNAVSGTIDAVDLKFSTVGVPAGTYAFTMSPNNAFLGSLSSTYSTTTAAGNNLTTIDGFLVVPAVPEPSSIVLGLFAVAGLGAVAIRRRRARA